jgi:hypothetical protein
MSEPQPFYLPTQEMLTGDDAPWRQYNDYAARLVDAGLERSFPSDAEARFVAIELLAERYAVDDLAHDPRLIADAIVEAVEIRRTRRP